LTITKADILRADDTLVPNLGSLKGKIACKMPPRVILNTLDSLPEGMRNEH